MKNRHCIKSILVNVEHFWVIKSVWVTKTITEKKLSFKNCLLKLFNIYLFCVATARIWNLNTIKMLVLIFISVKVSVFNFLCSLKNYLYNFFLHLVCYKKLINMFVCFTIAFFYYFVHSDYIKQFKRTDTLIKKRF